MTWTAIVGLPWLLACPSDDTGEQNMLPTTASASGSTSNGSGATEPPADTGVDETADDTAGTAGSAPVFPATYRFDCIDILELGDSNMDGQPDGEAIQATLLENTWLSDIQNFKLNVMLTVQERDEESGASTIVVGSGVGPDAGDLCTEPSSVGTPQAATFQPGVAQWQPVDATGSCSGPADGGEAGGTYSFELAAGDTIYVYAEDDDGTVFNCVPGGAAPNAVPLHAVVGTVTVDANEGIAAGQLTGCLVDSEAQALCSCLGECSGTPHESCGGCPDGGVPLGELLGGVGPTDACTATMGETAYDLTVGFTTTRLSIDEPMLCG